MAAQLGSQVVVSFKDGAGNYQPVAGLRTRRIALNAQSVDVTNADSVGLWRELLDGGGVRSASVTGDGVFTDGVGIEAVRDAFFDNQLRDAKLYLPSFGTFEGKFMVSQLELGADFSGEVTNSMTLDSASVIVFTAGA